MPKKPKKDQRTARIVFYVTPSEKKAAAKFAQRGMYQMSVGAVARYAFAQFMEGAKVRNGDITEGYSK